MRFTLRELILALTLFAIGIPTGWYMCGFFWHERLTESANRIGTTVVYRFKVMPDLGLIHHSGPPLPVTEERLDEVVGLLIKRNALKFQGKPNAPAE